MKLARRVGTAFFGLLLAAMAFGKDLPKAPPTIIFMTDFGVRDDSVAICKAVMYGIAPQARIVDLTHDVTPFSIADGERFLFGATPYFPAGTVFVVVVDPGVGSGRKAIIAKSKQGQFFVLPDNGLLTMVADRDGIEAVREITNPAWMIGARLSSTFHGRDIFSPAGAHLARGDDWTAAGPELAVRNLVRLEVPAVTISGRELSGTVLATDGPFGNLVTNIAEADFAKLGVHRGEKVKVSLGAQQMEVPFVKTFSDVPLAEPLLYIDSRGRLALALNQANFAAKYRVAPPQPIVISAGK